MGYAPLGMNKWGTWSLQIVADVRIVSMFLWMFVEEKINRRSEEALK